MVLSSTSLAGILGLIFGPPVLIFFAVMALKIYLRISSNEEALNEVRSTMQARRSRHILGLEGGSQALAEAEGIINIEDLANIQSRQTREERIQDCINVFTVPDSSSAFLRFATSESDQQVSEMASSQFSSSQLHAPNEPQSRTPPPAPASVKSAQTSKSVQSQATGGRSQKSKTSQKSTKSSRSQKSRGISPSPRVSSMSARRSIDSFVTRLTKHSRRRGDVCIICMDGYRHGDIVCKTRCKHVFHKECIEEWMKKHNRCPLCRNDLFRGDENT
ncbi:unnamed protein product [Cylindrotheca closterium]|uniref:RING-type domain-containing protein n=1 Tax=Cylindrotheca closterium TaxID=2856 RepID=A0AAD2FYD8_9STRA|nr:unnamed protein product [Cylindrotheca closterium]